MLYGFNWLQLKFNIEIVDEVFLSATTATIFTKNPTIEIDCNLY